MSGPLLALAFLFAATAEAEEDSASAAQPADGDTAPAAGGPPDPDPPPTGLDAFMQFRTTGPHLDIDLTPTLEQLFPPDPANDDDEAQQEPEGGRLSLLPLPDIRYNPDEGLGLGLAVPIIWTEPGADPYKYSFVVQLVTSTKLVQDQALLFDIVDILGFPLRWSGQVGFYAFADEPFCGVGSTATCDAAEADAAGARVRDEDEALERTERYYVMRLVRPYAWSILRYELFDFFGKWEAFGGLRSEWYFPGFFGNVLEGEFFRSGPYPGSKFAQRDGEGEPGYVNIPQLGLMVDTRDFEPSPRSGYWVEASVRGAHQLAGSYWAFGGGNITARHYAPLLPSKNLTLATRLIADVITGNPPVQELARFGGSVDYRGFGGRWVGRGMRQQRYIGNIKLAYQSELRWDAIRFDVSTFSLGFEFVTFLDAGMVFAEGVDYQNPSLEGIGGLQQPLKPLVAGGVGLRWVINRAIVIRADLGVAPEGGFFPQFYFDGRHIF